MGPAKELTCPVWADMHDNPQSPVGVPASCDQSMTGSARHLHRDQYRSMPWRNGAGVTLEIAREPAAGSDFLWRLSLATVAASGPFSNYAGYRRSVTLIDGAGFRLGIDGQQPLVLDSVGATALFPGDAATQCTLINGASTDLSLMVREPGAIISVQRIQDATAREVPLQAGALKAVFCVAGASILAPPDNPMASRRAGADMTLAAHDTVLLGLQAAVLSVRPASDVPTDLLLLTWQAASAL